MQFSAEIIDHIFSFLSRETLVAWSKDPALYPIVERYLYHHLIVHIGKPIRPTLHHCSFEPNRLSKFVFRNPRILNYVRILQIEFRVLNRWEDAGKKQLDQFAKTLRRFPLLECIILTTSAYQEWYWSGVFRAALDGRLSLPTVREVHLMGHSEFPSSLLDNRENIKNVSFSALALVNEGHNFKLPKLQTLALSVHFMSFDILSWIKLHISDLKSLKYTATSGLWPLSDILGVCSQTLERLDISLVDTKCKGYFPSTYGAYLFIYLDHSDFKFETGESHLNYPPEFLPIPYNPQQLTLRTSMHLTYDSDRNPKTRRSSLTAVVQILESFISSPQHLVLDIDIRLENILNLANVDFSPLVALFGASSLSIPRIDLYVHTGCNVTHAQLLSLTEDYEDVVRSIEDGVLVIHSEKVAPECV
jgi:hypothetical protein